MIGSLTFFILSCRNTSTKVGYLNWNGENEIAAKTLEFFKEKTTKLGVEVLDMDAHNNDKEQYEQAMELINQGVKVLVIKPVNSVTAAAIVREANKKGVVVIANDQLIKNCDLDYYVTFDSRKVGEYMAKEAIMQKPEGTYVLLGGDKSDDNADLVREGVLKVLQPQIDNHKINVLYNCYIEDWSEENAKKEFETIIRLSPDTKIDAVIASCDDMARGAINVLKKNNLLNDVYVSGQNADLLSLRMIIQGEQSITIAKSPKITGYALAALAVKVVTKSNDKLDYDINANTFNGVKEVPSILFDPEVVNKENLEQVISKDGIVKREELFEK